MTTKMYEQAQIGLLKQEYLARGYEVHHEVPLSTGKTRIDILAIDKMTNSKLIVEVVNFRDVRPDLADRVKAFQNEFKSDDNVNIEFRYIDIPESGVLKIRQAASEIACRYRYRNDTEYEALNEKAPFFSPTISLVSDWTRLSRLIRSFRPHSEKKGVLDIYNELLSKRILRSAEGNIQGVDLDIFALFNQVEIALEGGNTTTEVARQMRQHLIYIQRQIRYGYDD